MTKIEELFKKLSLARSIVSEDDHRSSTQIKGFYKLIESGSATVLQFKPLSNNRGNKFNPSHYQMNIYSNVKKI